MLTFMEEQLKDLKLENTTLIILVIVALLYAVMMTLLYMKHRKAHSLLMQKNEQIERHHRENNEIMQILEQKKHEIEQQALALDETTVELHWQTENALRLYDEVEQQKEEITDSIIYAKRIQTALLPDVSQVNEILNDYFVLYKPRDIVSGDFYWVTAKQNKTIVAVADCTGHGVPGAFMSILGVSFLNEIIRNYDLQVDEVLNLLREQVIKSLKQMEVVRDGMDMALCAIDWEKARIEYAGANIPLFLLRAPTHHSEELTEIPPDRMPIGLYEKEQPFTRHIVPLTQGDALYLCSDGYCDQFGGPNLKKFKKKNLKKLLLDIYTQNMSCQKKILETTLEQWKGDLPQVDDILMLGIKI
ncbi:MAG: SpoIIE family protein phosphatase [Bacteroidales bacterium]|jgi:serine phosphatase RsbU (regulator of sigma subunit)|nr:SpoIIE family protein phosphatase [Bacteroidales bacterium]